MKYLIKKQGYYGIFLFPENDFPFVVATIEEDNGLGRPVTSWHHGRYFKTLDDAFEFFVKLRR